ncbi:Tryptophan synthase alpha chain [Cystobacter fuscus DSM 2262]|uniref:Tryptophan synthase alpha chain n=1 Tax=Cystobacter fuscus (strain ATCC 25194 / DSM 2262 / NBRC 100088 / M29) TaxID=1242864 RepID=S9R832_CYSF2|nr:tryptophan synthase subunit alpha [Cystobacter fuscus]EPX65238.1 Tryptophan synthase alpha chain [Cystobacter fuscus DSM 2262]WNG30034.1 tryptophan synthase subunit alpha [Cystobacter fuscus]
MSGAIADAFARAKARGEGALVAYAMAGDPDLPRSVDVFAACVEGGADILEIGVAFSDPIADGPVIQGASERALKAGSTLRRVLDEVVPAVRERCPQTPLVVMTYVNVIMALGEERYAKLARERGVSGTILPDLPPEESVDLRQAFDREGVELIPLCAPTTSPKRAESIAKDARGFVYCVSVAGVTGMRSQLPADLSERLELVRRVSPVPVVAGFGISSAEQARVVGAHADGVVVGSAIVRAAQADGPSAARQVCADIKRGLKR